MASLPVGDVRLMGVFGTKASSLVQAKLPMAPARLQIQWREP